MSVEARTSSQVKSALFSELQRARTDSVPGGGSGPEALKNSCSTQLSMKF